MAEWTRAFGARWAGALAAAGMCVAAAGAAGPLVLTVDAPVALAPMAERAQAFDAAPLERALAAAGLEMPSQVHVTLVAEDDPYARATPRWTVGRAWGDREIEIFPDRVSVYPNDSLESVLRHEIVHLALDLRAGGHALPRWFHEGVAQTVGSDWGVVAEWRLWWAEANGPGLPDVATLFQSDREQETADAYRLATALVDDLRRRYGPGIPGAIAARVADGLSFDRAFTIETGERVDEAAARVWRRHQRVSRWIAVASSGQVLWTLILVLAVAAMVARLRRRARLRRFWDAIDGGG